MRVHVEVCERLYAEKYPKNEKEPTHEPKDSITNISIFIKTQDSRKFPQDTEISRVDSPALFYRWLGD